MSDANFWVILQKQIIPEALYYLPLKSSKYAIEARI